MPGYYFPVFTAYFHLSIGDDSVRALVFGFRKPKTEDLTPEAPDR